MGMLRDALVGVLYFGVRTFVLVSVMGRTLWLAVLWEEEFLGLMLALEKEEFLGWTWVLEEGKKFLGWTWVFEKEDEKFLGWTWVVGEVEFLGWTWVVGEEEEGCQLKTGGRK